MKVTISENDIWSATKLHMRPDGIAIFGLIFFIGVALTYAHQKMHMPPLKIAFISIGAILGFLSYMVIVRFRCKKMYRQQKNLQVPYELTWDSNGMHTQNTFGNATAPWSNFTKYKENNHVIIMYYSDYLYNLVTKSSFSSPEQLNDFKQHLSNIGS